MHEIEFLPEWYPRQQRRRRAVIVQAWVAAGLVLLLVIYSGKKQWDAAHAARAAVALASQIDRTQADVARLDELLHYQQQLRQQEKVIARVGLNVETTRLLGVIEDAMPSVVAMTGLSIEAEEQLRPMPAGQAVAVGKSVDRESLMDRKLRIRLQAVAPSDMQVAELLARLSAIHFLDDLNMSYARDRIDEGRLMREFEVTFSVNVTAPAEGFYAEAR